ncbi:MAG: thioredoxin family protein [Synergistaceae bacterium]|nr:thioredoxin family protein [Synergistaceae bacterium]
MRKIIFALVLVVVMVSTASAAVPSVTMLSTKTCPACAQMSKVFSEINAGYKGRLSTAHIYLENNPDIAKKYNVRYVPTLIFRDASGKEIAQAVGYKSLKEVLKIFADKGVKI